MNDLGIIDRFTETFGRYIDSGFGLLQGEVAFLTGILIAIDITLAGLRWAGGHDSDVMAHLIRKVLYVGAFAFILNNWPFLTGIIFKSFTGLGLQATDTGLTPEQLLNPGFIAATGYDAAQPLLHQAGELAGFTTFVPNLLSILVLLFAWFITVLAFFVLAIQLFITIIEFKLTALAGFILVPFALWNKSAFLAERVLGNVISSGVKMMVLAIIIGIGSTFFSSFGTVPEQQFTLAQAMALVLGALSLFALGIFGPGIAAGLVAGAPQLGAGAAIGTAGAALGAAAFSAGGSLTALRAGTTLTGNAAASYRTGRAADGTSGLMGAMSGIGGMAHAGMSAAMNSFTSGTPGHSSNDMPAWAKNMQARQRQRNRTHTATQAVKDGDKPGSGANPDLDEKE